MNDLDLKYCYFVAPINVKVPYEYILTNVVFIFPRRRKINILFCCFTAIELYSNADMQGKTKDGRPIRT